MKGKFVIALLPVVMFYISSCQQDDVGKVSLKTQHDSVAYLIGYNIGNNLANSPMTEINYKAIAWGMQDAVDKKELFMELNYANMFITQYMQRLEQQNSEANLAEGRKFLEENKKRKGVTTTESGLQYEVLVAGDGPRPADTSTVTAHYHGTLIDGTVFESSVEDGGEPATFKVNRVIKGWTEALQLMPVGSKWKIYLPAELAYGASPRPGGVIKPNMALIFEIELISID